MSPSAAPGHRRTSGSEQRSGDRRSFDATTPTPLPTGHTRPAGSPATRRGWRDDAACLGHDPGCFFPVGETGLGADQLAEAKQVCAGCTVQGPCLEWALASGADEGVFGGLGEAERRALRLKARRRRPTTPTTSTP